MMYGNYGWGWMALMPVLWIALIGIIVWAVFRLARQDPSSGSVARTPEESAREALDRRFVSGEIDGETYVRMRDQLIGQTPQSSS